MGKYSLACYSGEPEFQRDPKEGLEIGKLSVNGRGEYFGCVFAVYGSEKHSFLFVAESQLLQISNGYQQVAEVPAQLCVHLDYIEANCKV